MQQPSPTPIHPHAKSIHPLALALGFGIAGVVVVLLFGVGIGSTWGMMSGTGGGWMHGAVSGEPGYGGGSMMGGGYGFIFYALIWGFAGAAIAGWVAAWIYNAAMRRSA